VEVPDYLKSGPNLTDEEAAELSARAQAGDRAARDRMVSCHMRLASSMARATRTRFMDLEERFQEALIILDRCTMHYNVRERVPFRVYAANQIRLRIMKAIEKERRAAAEVDPPPITERQERILELRARGMNYREVAEELGLSVDVVEEEGSRVNEAFAAEALHPQASIAFIRRQNRQAVLAPVHHGTEGEQGDLDRLIRKARKDGLLTETQERVVRLRAEGLIFPEIAQALGISRRSVTEGFHRAQRALAEVAGC